MPGGLAWTQGSAGVYAYKYLCINTFGGKKVENLKQKWSRCEGNLTHRFLNEVDAGLQVKAEVNEAPLDALPLVLLLLQNEHGVVEELLQLLIGVVDTQLLK